MSLTPRQHELRRDHLTASEAPAVCLGEIRIGGRVYQTPADVWANKVYEIEPDDDTMAQSIGRHLEWPLIDWCAEQLGVPVTRRNPFRVSKQDPLFSATFDARVAGKPEAIECKTSSLGDDWGAEGTDQVPERVLIQCQQQCYVGELDRVWVPVLLPAFRLEFRLYEVTRNDRLIELITEQGRAFWDNYVLPKVKPPSTPSLELLKRIRREPESWVDFDADTALLLDDWQELKRQAKEFERHAKECQAAIIAALGTAEGARLPDGGQVTYLESERKGYEVKPTKYRTLRVKHAKS